MFWSLVLNSQLPLYASEFHAVRNATGLPPSRYLPAPNRTQLQNHTSGQQPLMSRAATVNAARSMQGRNVEAVARRNVTTVRPTAAAPEDGDEPPPPPYTRQDPEPEATRVLQDQLAAQEEQTQFSAPPGPPPNTAASAAPARAASPLTAEEREIREQSEMEEAQRQSALEKERFELEEAVRLSLEETQDFSSQGAGPSRPSMYSGGKDSDSRRASSYQPLAQRAVDNDVSGPPVHRRTTSDAAQSGRPNTNSLRDQMANLSIPNDWQASPAASRQDSLMDRPDSSYISQAPLEPMRTGMQSNNPFLSAAERASATQQPPPLPARNSNMPQMPTASGSSHTIYEAPEGPPPPPKVMSPQHTASTSYPPPSGPPSTAGPSRQMSMAGRRGDLSRQLTEKGAENPLEMLRSFDTVFLSKSQASRSCKLTRQSMIAALFVVLALNKHDLTLQMIGERWEQARDSVMDVAEQAAQYDADGVDVYFLNDSRKGLGLTVSGSLDDQETF